MFLNSLSQITCVLSTPRHGTRIMASSLFLPPFSPPLRFPHLPPSRRVFFDSKNPILIGRRRLKPYHAASLGTSESKGIAHLPEAELIRKNDLGMEIDDGITVDAEAAIPILVDRGFFESVLNKMSKWLVAGIFGLVILCKHDGEAVWIATGSIFNSWLSFTLKGILNHQRPMAGLRSDPGMPSSHAQSIFYIAGFTNLLVIDWLGINSLSLMIGALIFICGSYLTWLRVSQKQHTVNQVVVGALLGLAFCASWFWMWHLLVQNAFDSSTWVRISVVLVSLLSCVTFLVYVVRNRLHIDNQSGG